MRYIVFYRTTNPDEYCRVVLDIVPDNTKYINNNRHPDWIILNRPLRVFNNIDIEGSYPTISKSEYEQLYGEIYYP